MTNVARIPRLVLLAATAFGSGPCEDPLMRQLHQWTAAAVESPLQGKLERLQRVAEAHWPEGARDRNGRVDPIFGSAKHNPKAVEIYAALASAPSIKTICEVGYNWGATALMWLDASITAKARGISFDLAERLYTNATLQYLNSVYDNRLTLIAGDSTETIPRFTKEHMNGDFACDLIFVDGDHSFEGESLNLKNFRELTQCGSAGSVYIMDDCDCSRSKLPTTQAFTKAVEQNYVVGKEGHKTINIQRRSQKFSETKAHHAFCTGTILPSPDRLRQCMKSEGVLRRVVKP